MGDGPPFTVEAYDAKPANSRNLVACGLSGMPSVPIVPVAQFDIPKATGRQANLSSGTSSKLPLKLTE